MVSFNGTWNKKISRTEGPDVDGIERILSNHVTSTIGARVEYAISKVIPPNQMLPDEMNIGMLFQ